MRTDEGSGDDDAAQMLRGIGLERKSSSRERGVFAGLFVIRLLVSIPATHLFIGPFIGPCLLGRKRY
jgi:hypothetical protein